MNGVSLMLIYLDSSIICFNFFMQGPTFDLMKKIGTIVISQIVFDEVCNKYREWLLEYQKKVRNGLEAANAMLSSPIENPLTSERLENEIRYNKLRKFQNRRIENSPQNKGQGQRHLVE